MGPSATTVPRSGAIDGGFVAPASELGDGLPAAVGSGLESGEFAAQPAVKSTMSAVAAATPRRRERALRPLFDLVTVPP